MGDGAFEGNALISSRLVVVCQQTCKNRDALQAQIEVNNNKIVQYAATVEQLRSELEQGRKIADEAKQLQAQQDLEVEKLKAALANETANVENARAAKQHALQER